MFKVGDRVYNKYDGLGKISNIITDKVFLQLTDDRPVEVSFKKKHFGRYFTLEGKFSNKTDHLDLNIKKASIFIVIYYKLLNLFKR